MAANDSSDPERHQRVKAVFLAALAVGEAERAAFLAERCADDDALRREVEGLLGASGGGATLESGFALREAIADLREPGMPERIGPYRPIRLLGRGGMGEVWLAAREDGGEGARFAVKRIVLHALNAEGRARFRREAAILARLDHPGIARVLDTGESGDGGSSQPWLAMEYVDGVPLGRWAADARPSLRERFEMLARIAEAVQQAHAQGVVHRDLKPENILVTPAGEPRVLDFGVARLVEGDERPTERMTRTGWLVGTPQYMSPEQVQAEPAGVGPASDVYALGVIGYELLAGRLPYEATSVSLHRAVVAILTVEPPALGTLSRELGGAAERVIAQAIAKDPAKRYANAGLFAADLRRLLAGRTVSARGPGLAHRVARWARRRRRLAGFVAVMAGLTVLFAMWGWGRFGAMSPMEVDSAYHRCFDDLAKAYPYIHDIPRVPSRVEEGAQLLENALARMAGLPERSYTKRLRHALELYLGTARLLQAEWSWEGGAYEQARMHFSRANEVPLDDPNWGRSAVPAEIHGYLQDLDPVNTLSLLASTALQQGELNGQAIGIVESWNERLRALELTRSLHGSPQVDGPLALNEPWVFRYNDMVESAVVRGTFAGSEALAEAALAYADSAWARRAALITNDSALGSVTLLRGRAFLLLGELTHSAALTDSALAHFERAFVYRGPERPVVFAETHRFRALASLQRAAQSPVSECGRFMEQAIASARQSVDVLADSVYSRDRAWSRGVLAAALIDRALDRRTALGLDEAQALLVENARWFAPGLTPRAYRQEQLLRARLERAQAVAANDAGKRARALELATRVRDLSLMAGDSLMLRRASAELAEHASR